MPGDGPAGVLFDLPGLTPRDYEALMQSRGIAERPPDGARLHLAGPPPAGGWLFVSVWESTRAFDRFARDQLVPAARGLGIPPVRPQMFPVHHLLVRASKSAESGTDFAAAVVALLPRRSTVHLP